MMLPDDDDINVVTGASVEQEDWSSTRQDWEDTFGIHSTGEPLQKKPIIVFPPGHTADLPRSAAPPMGPISVDSTPDQDAAREHISPEHFKVFTRPPSPSGSGSQRPPPLQFTSSSLAEMPDAGGMQRGEYAAYDGAERDLLSQSNAQAYGIPAPTPWVDQTQQLQMVAMQNRLAQMQAAQDQQIADK